jgi:peptidoglycan/LPS O-acetylase OafA/YrhL
MFLAAVVATTHRVSYNGVSGIQEGNGAVSMKRTHYPAFDWIRLLLAVDVLAIHACSMVHADRAHFWFSAVEPVPCFLALSGFMVLGSLKSSRNIGHFWWKRILRIAPALIAAIILSGAVWGAPGLANSLKEYLTGGLIDVSPGDGPLWSLAWEELIYVALCLAWLAGAFRDRRWLLLALPIATCPMLLITGFEQPLLVARTHMALAFVLGTVAYSYQAEVRKWSPWLLLLPLVAFVVMHWAAPQTPFGPGYVRQVFNILAMGSFLLLAGVRLQVASVPQDWSYSCYVYHYPLLLTGHLWLLPFLCWASCRWIERPALALKNWRPPRRRPTLNCEDQTLAELGDVIAKPVR